MNKIFGKIAKAKKFVGKNVWKLFWASLVLGVFVFFIEFSFLVVLQGFLRAIGLIGQSQTHLPFWYPSTLLYSMLIFILFGIFRGIIYMIRYYISGAITEIFASLQRQRVLEYGLRYAGMVTSGKIVALFSIGVTNSASVLQVSSQLIITLTSCLLFFIYGTMIAPIEMVLSVATLALLMVPLRKFNMTIIAAGDGLRDEWSNVNNVLIQGLRNNFFLKIYNQVESEIQKARSYLKNYNKHYLSYYKISALKNHTPNIIGIFVICGISFMSTRYIHTKPILLISFFYIFMRFTQGLADANTGYSNLKLFYNSFLELYSWHKELDRVNKLQDEGKYVSKLKENPFYDSIKIEVKNLTFSFPSQPTLFKDLNFSVKKGEVLLIKGPSGVGKSTLLMLILGFLKPNEGEITFNQHNVQETLPFLSDMVGYVGPEPYIVAGTIKENILFGVQNKNEITDEMIEEVMKKAQLDIEKFNLNFFVAEQATLSTGQKQRLSIARAFLRKPKLLILDEATANLDGETEQSFTNNIKDMLGELTTIIISHKSSFDQIATSILTLKLTKENSITS